MLYPLKFKSLYKDYIWGGRNLEQLGKILPEGNVAESWELSCHPDGESIISNGAYENISLAELIQKFGSKITGTALPNSAIEKFPLLIKFIDANDKLSVQVHPKDEYAYIHENGELGKNEMWYIIQAKDGAKLVYDVVPGTTKESFKKAIEAGNINDCLKYIPVKAGDFLNIPAGLVHAIGEGIVLAEVQQNSNTTYRVYDYDRTDKLGNKRPLHIEKALDVINFSGAGSKEKAEGLCFEESGYKKSVMIANKYFAVEQLEISESISDTADGSKFLIYIFTEGIGQIKYKDGTLDIKYGETILIPAATGDFIIEGRLKAIKSYVPDIEKDIIEPLISRGFTRNEIITKVTGLA